MHTVHLQRMISYDTVCDTAIATLVLSYSGLSTVSRYHHTKEVMFSSMLVHLLVSRITAVAGKTKAGMAHSDCG